MGVFAVRTQVMKKIALLLLSCLPLVACTTPRGQQKAETTPETKKMRELVMDPLHLGLQPDAELGLTDFDAATLFHEGLRLHEAERHAQAMLFYKRLLREFPDSRFISAAAFNAGRCAEALEQDDEALTYYRLITEGMPQSKDWVDAMFRGAQVLIHQARHAEAVTWLDRLLDKKDLSVSDRIDALVLKGESLAALGKSFDAETVFRSALRIFRKNEREQFLDPAPAARAEFRMAELVDLRFVKAPLRLPEDQMHRDLEAKAHLLLKAQSGFLRTMRYGDPDWATAAGYRIGRLYLELHTAMNTAPVPADLSADEVRVYRDLLRKRLAVLLRKALKVFEMTMQLAERTRSDNSWTRAARTEMKRVEELVLKDLKTSERSEKAGPIKAPDPPPVL